MSAWPLLYFLFMADVCNVFDTFIRPNTNNAFFYFSKILIRCWDTRVQIYSTSARKIFGVAKKRRVPAEKCSSWSIKRLICWKQKHWSKRWVLIPPTGALITSADNSWPPPLPFHTALKNSSAEHIHVFLYIFLCAWVWVRQYVCVCVCVSVCCLSMWVSLFVMVSHVNKARICSADEWLCVYVCEFVSVCVYLCEWVCVCVFVY